MKIKKSLLLLVDIISVNLALIMALYFRYNLDVPELEMEFYLRTFIFLTVGKILIYYLFTMYDIIWMYGSMEDLIQIVYAVTVANIFTLIFMVSFKSPISLLILLNAFVLEMALISGTRFCYKLIRRVKSIKKAKKRNDINILIIGTGATADMIAKEINNHSESYGHLVGFIDDNYKLIGKTINGKKVLGNKHDISSVVKKFKVKEIILAIPTANRANRLAIIDECNKTNCVVKTIPGITEILDGKVSLDVIRNIELEDLLGRDALDLEMDSIINYISNKKVLITGGGGSIGAELCRQIARFNPSEMVILDSYENNAYEIENELTKKYADKFTIHVLIASIRDEGNMDNIFKVYKPEVVFHAAAHKHVPLMEAVPREAIINNCFGTLYVAQAADRYKAEKFVFISTDKAVNSTSIMGASKKICEMIIESISSMSETKFSLVRFGNVLGSNGSAIPLFLKQIEEGGPVSVTHKDIFRYFMTISEATQLVIQSGAYAKGGEVFILDMGEPVNIYKLAEDLIKLAGLKPNVDIDIEIVGLRPGEKLYEELQVVEEDMQKTNNKKIFIAKPIYNDYNAVITIMEKLQEVLLTYDNTELLKIIKKVVPTYNPKSEIEQEMIYANENMEIDK